MNDFKELLLDNPIIGSVKNKDNLRDVLKTDVKVVFVLFGNLTNIQEITNLLKQHNKIFFIHVDMIDGLKSDNAGIMFLKKTVNPYGIISTKQHHLKIASKCDLKTIMRMFIIDSMSLGTCIKTCNEYRPSAIEVLPGISDKIIKKVNSNINIPLIAGGLIEDKADVLNALNSGALAISTTNKEIWNM
ncbi:MAG: glycerol-3-phosphate responsive antiterminator [Lachnospirales bacterium]